MSRFAILVGLHTEAVHTFAGFGVALLCRCEPHCAAEGIRQHC
jgi:hypothetical protein